jgi:hypothetical protein
MMKAGDASFFRLVYARIRRFRMILTRYTTSEDMKQIYGNCISSNHKFSPPGNFSYSRAIPIRNSVPQTI